VPLPPIASPGRPLDRPEVERYARHVLLPQVGKTGQERLSASRVLVVGAGGLGSPALLYLAAAGVGTLGVVDADVVETSNLQRQLIHSDSDVGRLKTESAVEAVA
jgi:adenylyltransferase/sulfurtransferase